MVTPPLTIDVPDLTVEPVSFLSVALVTLSPGVNIFSHFPKLEYEDLPPPILVAQTVIASAQRAGLLLLVSWFELLAPTITVTSLLTS